MDSLQLGQDTALSYTEQTLADGVCILQCPGCGVTSHLIVFSILCPCWNLYLCLGTRATSAASRASEAGLGCSRRILPRFSAATCVGGC